MRLETAHETQATTSIEFLFFAAAGLISGLVSWLWSDLYPRFLTIPVPSGFNVAQVNVGPALLFAVLLGVAFYLTGAGARLQQSPLTWVAAFLGTIGLYLVVVGLLFAGYFSQLFGMPGWLNFALCGIVGAAVMGLITGTVTRSGQGALLGVMVLCGALSGLAALHPIFLFPWWQFSVATLIGLWVQAAEEG